mgnify:FL=1
MAWTQDTSQCVCVEPPICPPPTGNNGGTISLPTVCGDSPAVIIGTGGPGGWIGSSPKPGSWDPIPQIPPFPPEPPQNPIDTSSVWICEIEGAGGVAQGGVVFAGVFNCKLVPLKVALNLGKPHYSTKAECMIWCREEPLPPGSDSSDSSSTAGGTGPTGPTGPEPASDSTPLGRPITGVPSGNRGGGIIPPVYPVGGSTNSNLPSTKVISNSLDPYSGGVYRPPTPTNSNIPSTPFSHQSINIQESSIVGTENIPGGNLPSSPTVLGSNLTYDSDAASQTESFVDYLKFDPNMQIYDLDKDISVQTSQTILRKAEVRSLAGGSPGDILNERIKSTLNDVLLTKGGVSFVPYNGVTVGSFLYDSDLVKNSLNQNTISALEFVKNQNLFSRSLDTYLIEAVKYAILNGRLEDYSADFFIKMGQSSRELWPKGLPEVPYRSRQEASYNLIRQTRQSLNPFKYDTNGNAQQNVRRLRQVPTDIDLTLPIVARNGKVTGARFSNDDGLPISTTGGTISKPKQQNEFFGIIKQNGSVEQVQLRSNRDIAYTFNPNQKSVIESYMEGGSEDMSFSVSSSSPSVTDIEVAPPVSVIPEILIFSSMRETITELTNTNPDIRNTQVTYELAWKPGDADSTFNSVVSPFVGPRATMYIASDDPIWNYILNPVQEEGRSFITATFTSINVPLDGLVYPRQIYTDFALAPTDVVTYDPLQGGSVLSNYAPGQNITRGISFVPSPFQSVQNECYVKSVPTSTDISGKTNIYGMDWAKNFSSGDYTKTLSKTNTSFSTSSSIFGKVYNKIKEIDSNYNLQDGHHGKRLPHGDLISFFDVSEFLETFKIPRDIKSQLFNGVYNNIKVYPLLKDALEKTYINSNRLIGTDLTSQQKQTKVPELPYFDSRYKGKLY